MVFRFPSQSTPQRFAPWHHLLLTVTAATLATSGSASGLPLHLDPGPTPIVVDPVSQQGSVFVFAAPDLPTLTAGPALLFQSNSPLPNGLRLAAPATIDFSQQGFFRAAFWPGLAPDLVDIPPGTFLMGTPADEPESYPWEKPQTVVTFTYGFKMGKYEVTQAEYQAVMGGNPSYFSGVTNRPVEQMTWASAMDYCARLTASQKAAGCLPAGWRYRLPTEAEWEYACRAGTTTAFGYGPALRSGMANFIGKQEYDAATGTVINTKGIDIDKPTIVGSYAPNAWGLYDMHGNLWEWCLDYWGDAPPGGNVVDPFGPVTGTDRVVRGGCWYTSARVCRSSYRGRGNPVFKGNETGFRIVLAPK